MKQFSMGNAWSFGLRFFGGRGLGHAIVLIGVGLLLPLALQYALVGREIETANATRLSWTGSGGAVMMLAVLALSFVLQTGSYFASWRLGLRADATLGGASGYGLLGGVVAIATMVLVALVATLVARTFWTSSVAYLAILLFLLPLLAAAALFYTLPAVLIAAGLALLLALAMLFGSITGQVGMAATMTGGSGAVAVLLLVLSVVTIWLAARLSCTTALMAERRSLNPFAAARESWRLTWDEQWAITRYLALIGFGLVSLIGALAVAVGFGSGMMTYAALSADGGIVAALIRLAVAVPFAFLTVMVPAGIYREVAESDIAAEVFA